MTQNVKPSRTRRPPHRGLFALFLLTCLGMQGLAACSSSSADQGATDNSDAGTSGCSGSGCGTELRFAPCQTSSQCDQGHGFSCVDGECSYACESHSDCAEIGHCEPRTLDGQRKNFCVRDPVAPEPGKLYTGCPRGDECADQRLCIGAGPGDLDAYCTVDCSGDDDCSAGYYCGVITRNPCEAACDSRAQPKDPRCIPSDEIGAGRPFRCGATGVERRVCRQREFCSACTSDADCLAVPNQVCARDESGEKVCTRLCDTEARSCPWGNAAQCGIYDAELGAPTCSHRFGSCHGNGATCEPCTSNDDCKGGVCTGSQFTGERWCVNLSTACECKGGVDESGACFDGGCPDSPDGLPIACIGDPRSALFNLCYAANGGARGLSNSSRQTGCWAAP